MPNTGYWVPDADKSIHIRCGKAAIGEGSKIENDFRVDLKRS